MYKAKKTRAGTWRMEVCVKGIRDGGTFATKQDAEQWGDRRRLELRDAARAAVDVSRKTVADVFDRYAREVSPTHAGSAFELRRLTAWPDCVLTVDGAATHFGSVLLSELSSKHIAAFRDLRLKTVTGSTVNRELNLMGAAFSVARREWHWIKESPTKDVTRPQNPESRTVRPSEDEIERLMFVLGDARDAPIAHTTTQKTGVAFLFAIETAMRLGEILSLHRMKPADYKSNDPRSYVAGTHAHLGKTKNGYARDVPLSAYAKQLIGKLPVSGPMLFDVKRSSLEVIFGRAVRQCGIVDLHFHDSRHEAITRLARKYDKVLELARVVGHRNLNELLTYYNPSIEELVAKI